MNPLRQMFRIFLQMLRDRLDLYLRPDDMMLAINLAAGVARLELGLEETALLAPSFGIIGPIEVSGNLNCNFTYKLFYRKIMEFIQVRIEIRMGQMYFTTKICSSTAPERHGEIIDTLPEFKVPFYRIAIELFKYFPLYLAKQKINQVVLYDKIPESIPV